MVILFGGVLIIWMMSQFLFSQIHEVFFQTMSGSLISAIRTEDYFSVMRFVLKKTFYILAPVLLAFFVISFIASIIQIGFLYNENALSPDFEKINPIEGFKRIWSLKSILEGAKAVLKVILVSSIILIILKSEMDKIPLLIHFSIHQMMSFVGDVIVKLLGGISLVMLILAGLDYFYLRWDLENKMKMTKQEVKEEVKSREGDPLIRARIRRIQREIANRRMMSQVPKADVIITNPTHIAVALRYDATMPAPKLLAKGADIVAQKIREIARENRIPIVENKPLARTIYKTLEIGQFIPRELYKAVAEVLSYVYKLKKKRIN